MAILIVLSQVVMGYKERLQKAKPTSGIRSISNIWPIDNKTEKTSAN